MEQQLEQISGSVMPQLPAPIITLPNPHTTSSNISQLTEKQRPTQNQTNSMVSPIHSLEDQAAHHYTSKTQYNDEEGTQLNADHEVSTPRGRRSMTECSVASSSAVNVSPNNNHRQRPAVFAIDTPEKTLSNSVRRPAIVPVVTSNPQRSLNSHHNQHSQSTSFQRGPKSNGRRRSTKCVVFNGTFPIDEPMSSRFEDVYAQEGSDSDYDEDFYREDDGEEHPDYDEYSHDEYTNGGVRKFSASSSAHLCEGGQIVGISDTTMINDRVQIRNEFETSMNKYDQLIAQRRTVRK